MPAGVDAVVFDVGGVLIEWDPRHLYRKLFDDPVAMEDFLASICTPEWNADMDLGRPFDDAVAELAAAHPEHAAMIAAYHERWDEMVPGEVPGSPGILGELLDRGVACYALTNFSVEKFERTRRRFAFLGRLRGVVVSGAERVVEPDPAIFEVLTSRFGLVPERTLFVDDSAANVRTARQLGFESVRFRSPDQLREELASVGLLDGPGPR